jgi:hypothetical protein
MTIRSVRYQNYFLQDVKEKRAKETVWLDTVTKLLSY